MQATCIAVLCAVVAMITCVEGFTTRPSLHIHRAPTTASRSLQASRAGNRRSSRTRMFFDFGKKTKSNARPMAGGTVKGGKKTKITEEVTPAQRRAREKATAIRERSRKTATRKSEGVFTPPQQFEAFKKARKEVPSGKGDAYWEKIAARVPGQNAAACKRVAESMLFEAAVGTKSNYFGGYIETIETPDYVDPEADIMFKINKLFGRGKK
ncbi:unnamed protein product [Ectocarpus sp. 4 AP-2014]